jgi:Carbohydrate family 9 binding domain-like
MTHRRVFLPLTLLMLLLAAPTQGADKPIIGLIPKAAKPIKLDGKLDDWDGAFATPVHIGHPDFDNRGAEFLYLWDEENLYIGLRCLDRKPAHIGKDNQLWNGDAVEFYLDTRRDDLGGEQFAPGVLHMFYTAFTGSEVKPRWAARDMPHQKGFELKGAEVAAEKTPWGYTVEFKLPWALFPKFMPKAGEMIGLECELCSSDGGPRSDRSFVYSSPASVGTPSAFGRVKLVEKLEPADLKPFGRAVLPLSVTKSANYDWCYATAGVSSTLVPRMDRLEGRIVDAAGKARKTTPGSRKTVEGIGLVLWSGAFELFDLPPGSYRLELTAYGKDNVVLTTRSVLLLHGEPAAEPKKLGQQPSPMVEHTRAHVRLKQEPLKGRHEQLSLGTLFLPEGLPADGPVPLLIHFHCAGWIADAAAVQLRAAALSINLGSGSSTYAKPFTDANAFSKLLSEVESKGGVRVGQVTLSGWSAGYGAVRSILRVPQHYDRVDAVLLLDALHAGYVDGSPGPRESRLITEDLDVFARFAADAVAGKKRMLVTDSEVFPGTFASTTETADFLLGGLKLRRTAILEWGPLKMQQLVEAKAGQFRLLGFAGNSAPDHVDHLHALPEFVKSLK